MWRSSGRFLPMIHRSQAAPLSFPPFSFSPASSSPQCLFDPGRCHRHCRSSPRLPSSSSCAYGTLESRRITGEIIHAILRTCWFIILLSAFPLERSSHLLPGAAALWLPAFDKPPGSTGWLLLSFCLCGSPQQPAAGPWHRPQEA